MQPLRGSGQIYFTCGFSPDGQTFAAGGTGHVVELWNLADPSALTRQIDTDGITVMFANYTPAGELVISRLHGALHLVAKDGEVFTTWLTQSIDRDSADNEAPSWRSLAGTKPMRDHVTRAALAADGKRLVTAGDSVTVWNVGIEFEEAVDILSGPGEYFTSAALSPDAQRFVSARVLADGGSVIEVWDVLGGDYYRQFQPTGTRVDKLAWSPDGRFLAGLVDKHLTVWDTATWEEVFGPLPEQEPGSCLAVAFHPSGEQLFTGDTNGIVSCWDMNSWHQLTSYHWDIGPIYCLAFAADGLRAAAAGHGAIILWDFDA